MTDNSLQNLLDRLRQGNVTHGWGAILAFSRDQVNGFLARQHIEGLEGLHFLLPYSDSFFVNDDQTEMVSLHGIVLGPPILSFEKASLNKSALTLTMNIIGGTYTAKRHPVLAPPTVLTAFAVTEDMGFHVRMEANLHQAYGEVDKRGRVTMDLSVGEKVVCNLGSVEKIRERMGQYFQRYFAGQPQEQRRFTLGTVELNNYDPLSPTEFAVRTQPAPGATDEQSPGYGDGAIVVFIRLKVQEGEPAAGLPIEGSGFPYLIPDDMAGGMPRFSATLLIARQYLPLATDHQLTALGNMVFPGDNVFVEQQGERYDPYDRVLFGNVALKPTGVTIEPATVELGAARTQQFVARRGDGSTVASVEWTVSSPDFPIMVGTIAADGLYTASAQASMQRYRLPLVVTARYRENGLEKQVSALVHERFDTVSIGPLIQVKDGSDPTPVTIQGTTIKDGPLSFRLLEPTLGARLEAIDANRQAYYPPPQLQSAPLIVQRIEATDDSTNSKVQASILLVNKSIFHVTEPYYVTGMAPGDTVQFSVEGIPTDQMQWTVLGEGTVDNGLFTAPAVGASSISVVMCELPPASPIHPASYGYSVVNFQPVQNEYVAIRWEELSVFAIEAPSGLVQGYSNGFQQIPVRITLETKTVDSNGQQIDVPVSDVELGTLRLVDEMTGQVVPFIDSFQEGIPYGSSLRWAAHVKANRFKLYSSTVPGQTPRQRLPQPTNNRKRFRELFVHLADEGSRSFYAEFRDQDGAIWRSNADDIGGQPTLTVQGISPPTPNPVVGENNSYWLARERVFSGEGDRGPDGDDDFNYFLDSVDHWRLSYKKPPFTQVAFSTLEMEGNISTIQWESENLEEQFFSYTGFAFYPQRYRGNDTPPVGLSFDPYYRTMLTTLGIGPVDEQFNGDSIPAPGELIISLHRVADMPYWHDGLADGDPLKLYRQRLDRPLVFVLLDEEGNRHRLQIAFFSPSLDDSRNQLKLSVK